MQELPKIEPLAQELKPEANENLVMESFPVGQDAPSADLVDKAIKSSIKDKEDLKKVREALGLSDQTENSEELKMRDVSELIKKHECLFVHMFDAFGDTKSGTVFRDGDVDKETQLKILLALQPTISTSTIRKGQSEYNTAGLSDTNVGVILTRGKVVSASPEDSRSKPTGLKTRSGEAISDNNIPLESAEAVDGAIENAGAVNNLSKYNEVVVENPDVGGIILALKGKKLESFNPVFFDKVTFSGKLPLYVMDGGVLHKANIDKTGEKPQIILGEEIKPEDTLGDAPEISPEDREALAVELFENSPFKTKSEDLPEVISHGMGQAAYLEERGVQLFMEEIGDRKMEKYVRDPNEDPSSLLRDGDDIYSIGSFKDVHGQIELLARRDKNGDIDIFKKEKPLLLGKSESEVTLVSLYKKIETPNPFDETPAIDRDNIMNLIGISLGQGVNGFDVHADTYVEDYFEGVNKILDGLYNNETDKEEDRERKKIKKQQIAMHVFGFGEQAGKAGENEVQERASALAKEIDPEGKFEETVAKRIGTFGGYKSSKEEFLKS